MTLADELAGAVDADATQRQDLVDAALSVGQWLADQGYPGRWDKVKRPRFCAASTFCPTVNASASCSRSSPVGTRGTDRTDPTPAGQAVNRRNIHPDRRRNRAAPLRVPRPRSCSPCFRELGRPQVGRPQVGRPQVAPTTRQERWSASPTSAPRAGRRGPVPRSGLKTWVASGILFDS